VPCSYESTTIMSRSRNEVTGKMSIHTLCAPMEICFRSWGWTRGTRYDPSAIGILVTVVESERRRIDEILINPLKPSYYQIQVSSILIAQPIQFDPAVLRSVPISSLLLRCLGARNIDPPPVSPLLLNYPLSVPLSRPLYA
jgi:hypothetical protein